MGLSYLRIEPSVVVFRRWPRRIRRIPRTEVDRFVVLKTRGEEGASSPRLGTGAKRLSGATDERRPFDSRAK
jgi:hypothetical protein